MVNELTVPKIKSLDLFFVLLIKLKIKQSKIFFHVVKISRFWNRDSSLFHMPAQNNLRDAPVVLAGNLFKRPMVEDVALPFIQGPHASSTHVFGIALRSARS